MTITEVQTSTKVAVVVSPANNEDLRVLTKKRYFFSWRRVSLKSKLYKLCITREKDILGVIALIDIPDEKRLEIKLLASSLENVGQNKVYENIAGCLIGFACREAVKRYADEACVSLVPKTVLKNHYKEKYKMLEAGPQLFVEGEALVSLIYKFVL